MVNPPPDVRRRTGSRFGNREWLSNVRFFFKLRYDDAASRKILAQDSGLIRCEERCFTAFYSREHDCREDSLEL